MYFNLKMNEICERQYKQTFQKKLKLGFQLEGVAHQYSIYGKTFYTLGNHAFTDKSSYYFILMVFSKCFPLFLLNALKLNISNFF